MKSHHNNDAKSVGDKSTSHASAFSASGFSSAYTWSEHSGGATPSGANNADQHQQFGTKEGQRVFRAKILVFMVLTLAACAMAAVVFWFVSTNEVESFETQFQNYASEIIAVSSQNANATFFTIESFAVSITSVARATNQTWPFVTVPDFAARATRVATSSGSIHFVWGPIVQENEREQWEQYALDNREWWFQQSLDYGGFDGPVQQVLNITEDKIYKANEYWENVPEDGPGPYWPIWQDHVFNPEEVWTNYNLLSFESIKIGYETMAVTNTPTLSFTVLQEQLESQLLQPIFDEIDTNGKKLVGAMWIPLSWDEYFVNLLPENADGIVVVLRSSCGQEITYQINGLDVELLGEGDVHDTEYDHLKITSEFQLFRIPENADLPIDLCVPRIYMDLYPSDTMKDDFTTDNAIWYTVAVLGIFLFTSAVFLFYDWMVKERQDVVMDRVIVTDKIVSNMFPTTFRDRLYNLDNKDASERDGGELYRKFSLGFIDTKLTQYIDQDDLDNIHIYDKKPIADLFLDTTIMVADICGFTAWSSQREPPQVFMLLEAIYGSFDKIARRYNVFKVETVGDCYVAVSGLPEAEPNHALIMVKFARHCMEKVKDMTSKLEVALGPDTGDLEMRIGLHSGQVTAGVLRGERTRFQLFGDTVNTASRMEATCHKSRIQVSSVTAELLIRKHERGKLLYQREDTVFVKGKGQMQTYWLRTRAEEQYQRQKMVDRANGVAIDDGVDDEDFYIRTDSAKSSMTKGQRLIEWNIDTLGLLLRQILASRGAGGCVPKPNSQVDKSFVPGATVLEEFDPIVNLPTIGPRELAKRIDPASVQLPDNVIEQLRDFVTRVQAGYRDNGFHNFEHASHVASSVKKMLSRIVAFDDHTEDISDLCRDSSEKSNVKLVDISGHSFGITSDPLTQFSVVFSAIIHDLDHQGVTNTQLCKEGQDIAVLYEKSVAEQNSVKLAWDMLMEDKYKDLRACIYSNEVELRHFRQLLVNIVLATDIADKGLQAARKERWELAFAEQRNKKSTIVNTNHDDDFDEMDPEYQLDASGRNEAIDMLDVDTDDTNRKATIVIEHLIQASDVSHTMQHWQIFLKWNEALFVEMLTAYREGRCEKNPKDFWYQGEIGFFDYYVIPLAKKLESCGVFGVSSHEYLSYAVANRDEWILSGEEQVRKMVKKYSA